jgi:hypothetical protein
MTGDLLIPALGCIRELPCFADRAKMAFVTDQAPYHMTVDVALEAAQLGMDPVPDPPGSTCRCHPMDDRVLGVLVRKQSKLEDDATRACPRGGPGPRQVRSARSFHARAETEANVVKSAWRCSRGEGEGV